MTHMTVDIQSTWKTNNYGVNLQKLLYSVSIMVSICKSCFQCEYHGVNLQKLLSM